MEYKRGEEMMTDTHRHKVELFFCEKIFASFNLDNIR